MGRIKKSLVHKLLRTADHPLFEVAKGWHVFSRYRTAELFLKHPAPASVRSPNDAVYQQLLKDYPEVKLQALRVNAQEPSLARRFVQKQQQAFAALEQQHVQQELQRLRQQGRAEQPARLDALQEREMREAAFKQAQEQMREELKSAGRETTAVGYLEFVQQQEEEALQNALKRLQEVS